MGLLVNLDGTISPTATVSVLERGFLYGDSIYEVVRTYKGQPFGVQEHLDRLRQSASYLYIDLPWSDDHIQGEIKRTLQQAGEGDYYIRIVVTRGTEVMISLQPTPNLQPSLIIIVSSIDPEPVLSEQGVALQIVSRQRNAIQALNPAAKTGNYLNNILALLEAQQAGADDALMLNAAGEITEATTSNLWLVKAGRVYTPPVSAGILNGITRYFLLQILQQQQIPHTEMTLTPDDLESAEEVFLSSSVRLLMPVQRIDEIVMPNCPGPMTRLLWQELVQLMAIAAKK